MEICKCWEEKQQIARWDGNEPICKTIQICNGTKEREICFCNGDESKCKFYPEKRKGSKSMNTAEMWIQAQEDGKYYITISNHDDKIIYNKNTGLLYNDDKSLCTPADYWYTFDSLMQEQWACCDNYMTKQEAEKKFGIKIIDD